MFFSGIIMPKRTAEYDETIRGNGLGQGAAARQPSSPNMVMVSGWVLAGIYAEPASSRMGRQEIPLSVEMAKRSKYNVSDAPGAVGGCHRISGTLDGSRAVGLDIGTGRCQGFRRFRKQGFAHHTIIGRHLGGLGTFGDSQGTDRARRPLECVRGLPPGLLGGGLPHLSQINRCLLGEQAEDLVFEVRVAEGVFRKIGVVDWLHWGGLDVGDSVSQPTARAVRFDFRLVASPVIVTQWN